MKTAFGDHCGSSTRATVEKVTDFAAIVGYGVMRTPGLVVDEKVVLSGRVAPARRRPADRRRRAEGS